MKKILLTGSNGMLANDFIKLYYKKYEIIAFDKKHLDITNIKNIEKKVEEIKPDIILNCAAYTAVDDAENIGMKLNYQINSLGVYNLAKISNKYKVNFITISTDYAFDGKNQDGYNENDKTNPLNQYGMAKLLGENLAFSENPNSIIIRTSWLYGGGKDFKNFVNTMLKLGKTHKELKVINDQFGIPTYTIDLSDAIGQVIDNIEKYKGNILHFSNSSQEKVTWFDFAKEIFKLTGKEVTVHPCSSEKYKTKAKRPKFSILLNNSDIVLRDWKEGVRDYLKTIK